MKTAAEIARSATLEDVRDAMASPSDIRVRIQVEGDEMREMGVARVSTGPRDRHIVVGRWPTCADPVVVRENEIRHLAVVFD